MVNRFFAGTAKVVSEFLQHPLRVLVTCLIVVFGTLILNGSFLHLWNLHHNSRNLSERINNLRTNSQKIEEKIIKARDPNFIEVEAREKFDLAGEGDLVFIFSDDD